MNDWNYFYKVYESSIMNAYVLKFDSPDQFFLFFTIPFHFDIQ